MKKLADADVDQALSALPGFTRDGVWLVRKVTAASFPDIIHLVNQIAQIAEAHDHHPDMHISWRTLTLRISTHDAGGLTQRDIDLARAISPLLGSP